jgi:hypothetical protein
MEITHDELINAGFSLFKERTISAEYILKPKNNYPFNILVYYFPEQKRISHLSIHSDEYEASGVPRDLINKEVWSEEDHKRVEIYRVKFPSFQQPIAYDIKTMERLNTLLDSLMKI